MTNLCMTLQIGATFDHPLVDLKKIKEYDIVKINICTCAFYVTYKACNYAKTCLPPSPSKGKKHGKKNLITNTKLFPSVECNMSFSPDPHIYFLEQH